MISARGLVKAYPTGLQVLAGVDFTVSSGSFCSLVGPSGCGKSTLLRILAGIEKSSGGSFSVELADSRNLSYVFQDPTLLPWLSVAANVRLPLELRGQTQGQARAAVTEVLERVGLADFSAAYPNELSGGMKMRASIARALVTRHGALLLDEPFAALDELARARLHVELMNLWRRENWTALFITHNIAEAIFLAERVLVMSSRPGRVAAEFPVPFPQPRAPALRSSPEFAALAGRVFSALEATSAP